MSRILLFLCIFCCMQHGLTEIPNMAKYYCIVGAGPAGLQMAYFLHRAERDYIVFEEAASPGSFFKRYPRHRKLISTNQRETGSTNKEYNLRHDLNSLISDNDGLRFTEYSQQHFPTAEELITYLTDYQKKLKLSVQFDTKISKLQHNPDAKTDQCRHTMYDQNKNYYCCRNVFLATGWHRPKLPAKVKGIENVETYETMSIDPKHYKDHTVLIIGRGFSGFETALSLEGATKDIHMASTNKIRLNWEAQYLGDVRNAKNGVLDAMLQNVEGFFEIDVENIEFAKRSNGKIRVITRGRPEDQDADRHLLPEGYDRVILCLGFEWDDSIFDSSMKVASFESPNIPKNTYPDMDDDFQSKEYPGLYFMGPLMHALDYRKSAGGFIHGFRNTERALHRLLEWRNHGVRWPSVAKTVDQLVPTLLKRANEASGLYHMFSFLCDLAIYDRSTKKFAYLEEFPISLIPSLLKNSGFEFSPEKHAAFVMTYQYEADFSQPGVDRLTGTRTKKHLEKEKLSILHPVLYFYNGTLPTVDEMKSRKPNEVLPNPLAIHHILQDITKKHDGPTAHIGLLRRFVEALLYKDLQSYTAETCARTAFTQILDRDDSLPLHCDFQNWKLDSVLSHV